MKTIAISLDEASLAAVDRMARATGRRRGAKPPNRSEVVRRAVHELIARHHHRRKREEGDRRILAGHRALVAREAEALVAEQAEP